MKVPVLLIAYRRPNETKKVLDRIREYYPDDLYVFVDSPIQADQDVEEVKQLVEKKIYASNIHTNFQKVNLGCGLGPVAAINWVLTHEKYAIILEDDCVPLDGFFDYMEWALKIKEKDSKCFMVSGDKYSVLDFNTVVAKTKFSFTHGWGTWRDAWKDYDYNISYWNSSVKHNKNIIPIYAFRPHWSKIFNKIKNDNSKTYWDYQWQLHVWKNNGYSLQPPVNLIHNIGFNINATHTFNESDWRSKIPVTSIPVNFRDHNPKFSFLIEFQNTLIELGVVSFLSRIYLKVKNKF